MTVFCTKISEVVDGAVNLRGYSLEEVERSLSHTEAIFLTIIGRLPTEGERRITEALLNTLLDHGWVASTVATARYAASGNPQLVPALAAGLLACGSNTVSPEHSFDMLDRARELRDSGMTFDEAASAIVDEYRSARRRVPGLGHPTHKLSDFRADTLWEIADSVGACGTGVAQFRAIQQQLSVTRHRSLPVNIDGAMAAIGYDLGWSATQTVAFALLSVLPGLMAHVIEEIDSAVPLRYIRDGEYNVAPVRSLPTLNTERENQR
jgi:citrate synthase